MPQDQSLEQQVRYLLDRAEIADVMGRYCLGMDLRDWPMYRSCWTQDVTFDVDDFGFEDRPAGKLGIDDWIASLQAFFARLEHSQHVKYPVSYAFDGDRAEVYAIMQGKHWQPRPDGDPLQTVVGYYRDTYLRTPEGWKMSASKEVLFWNEGDFAVIEPGLADMFAALRAARPANRGE
jgi:hypothetical protein